jgi:hypothetical protein
MQENTKTSNWLLYRLIQILDVLFSLNKHVSIGVNSMNGILCFIMGINRAIGSFNNRNDSSNNNYTNNGNQNNNNNKNNDLRGPIVVEKCDRQTWTDPLRCSSLMLEREEHLKMIIGQMVLLQNTEKCNYSYHE